MGTGLNRSGWKAEKGLQGPPGVCQAVGVSLMPKTASTEKAEPQRRGQQASGLTRFQESGRMKFKRKNLWSDLQKFLDIWKLMECGKPGV